MLPTRRGSQGRYPSRYSVLQRETQALIQQQAPAIVQCEPTGAVPQDASTVIHQDFPARTRQDPVLLRDVKFEKKDNKMSVNCGILGGKGRQWGKLEDTHAGVLKFLTSLSQGKGYRVDQVTVEICFTEHGPNEDNANTTLVILVPPYPTKTIFGEPRKERFFTKRALSPKVQVPGGGGELGGYEQTLEGDFVRSWDYSCCWLGRHEKYTAAEWTWRTDDGDPKRRHVSRLYSGVVVGHACQPFWVGCKIQLWLSLPGLLWRKRYRGQPSEGDGEYKFKQVPVGPTNDNLGTVINGLDKEITQLMCLTLKPEENENGQN